MGESPDLRSDLIDVTGIDLDQLMDLPDSVLTESLLRILRDVSVPPNQYAKFQDAIG
ncbi:MAG TPA: FxSxx-COOH cyclophane-containing RiPP peptide [Pseudonocardiaceae bacterium]